MIKKKTSNFCHLNKCKSSLQRGWLHCIRTTLWYEIMKTSHVIVPLTFFNTLIGTLVSLSSSSSLSAKQQSSLHDHNIRFRQGTWQDLFGINIKLIKSASSLSFDCKEFIIAQDVKNKESSVVGWGQLRYLGPATSDPNQWDSDVTSTSTAIDIEKEADEIMWEQFEDDPIEFPNGWSSLPWTKEYRRVAQAAEMKRYQRAAILEKERIEAGKLYELTSLNVQPSHRNRGIATNMIQKLLQNSRRQLKLQQQVDDQQPSYSYVLTLDSYVDWYGQFGFDSIVDAKNIPNSLQSKYNSERFLETLQNDANSDGTVVCMRALL